MQINYQHEFTYALADFIMYASQKDYDEAQQFLNEMTNINDGWIQSPEDKQANCLLIEAAYSIIN